MNPNIKVINKNLWAVKFSYIEIGFIQELQIINNEDALKKGFTYSDDGKIILDVDSKSFAMFCRGLPPVMGLSRTQLRQKHCFYQWFKVTMNLPKDYTDTQVKSFMQNRKQEENANSVYKLMCDMEAVRKQLAAQYLLKNPIHIIEKAVKNNGNNSDKH